SHFLSRVLVLHGIDVYEDVSPESIRSAWYAFRYSQGREMKGVVNRRTSEMTVFFDGVYIII
ncbi:hypothetical protein EEA10_22570, partial [Salmonella enterica]|nr:hypothetical protein [Salmonella enterica]